jgi:AraC-like DNA-binding protein
VRQHDEREHCQSCYRATQADHRLCTWLFESLQVSGHKLYCTERVVSLTGVATVDGYDDCHRQDATYKFDITSIALTFFNYSRPSGSRGVVATIFSRAITPGTAYIRTSPTGTHVVFRTCVDWRVSAALEMMRRDLAKPLSVGVIARSVHLSSSRLTQLFRQEMGTGPVHYLRQMRLDRAYDLVLHSTLSIKQVMAAVGFSDPSHFTRDFAARHGASPRQVRARAMAASQGQPAPRREKL